jgi:hypothetical protein
MCVLSSGEDAVQPVIAARDLGERLNAPCDQIEGGFSPPLSENLRVIGAALALLDPLSRLGRKTLVRCERRRVLYRGQTLFKQSTRNDGLFLIETEGSHLSVTTPRRREIRSPIGIPAISGPPTKRTRMEKSYAGECTAVGGNQSRDTRCSYPSGTMVRARNRVESASRGG